MLTWIFFVGAVICLAYFIVILIYSGITTTSALIWLTAAVFLLATAFFLSRWLTDRDSVPMRLPVAMITLCAAGLVIMMILEILIFTCIPAEAEPGLDYVIVLGSSVRNDAPGKILVKRLDKAAEYIRQNPSTILILSGGKDGYDSCAEALVMKDYLIEKGVPETSMIIEDKSRNTKENIIYSRLKIAQAQEQNEEDGREYIFRDTAVLRPDPRIGILTSNFHLYRAMHIAQKQQIGQVYGIAAECDRILLVHFSVRDALAILKERLIGNL